MQNKFNHLFRKACVLLIGQKVILVPPPQSHIKYGAANFYFEISVKTCKGTSWLSRSHSEIISLTTICSPI